MTAPDIFSLVPLTSPDQEIPPPDNGPYFLATKNGYMAHLTTHWGHAIVPVKSIDTLAGTDSTYWHEINLPADLIGQAWGFFRQVWNERKSEAMVDITWSREHGYRLFVPPQDCTMGGVHAKRTPEHYRGRIVGTIHSHCNFSAYHSGTDTHDADGHDGLHMTIGHVHEEKLDIACMLSANGIRWEKIDFIHVVRNPEDVRPIDPPDWWIKQLDRYKPERKPSESAPKPITSWKPAASSPKPPTRPYGYLGTSYGTGYGTSFTSLDALVGDLPPTDDRIPALGEIQEAIDNLSRALEELGIDFDYEVEEAFNATEMTRLNQYFRDLETNP